MEPTCVSLNFISLDYQGERVLDDIQGRIIIVNIFYVMYILTPLFWNLLLKMQQQVPV